MKKIIITLLIITSSAVVFADDVIQSNFNASDNPTLKSDTSSSPGCMELGCTLWVFRNLLVGYLDYPYQNGYDFNFVHPDFSNRKKEPEKNENEVFTSYSESAFDQNNPNDNNLNSNFYNIETGIFSDFNGINIYTASLRGRFWRIFGPQIDLRVDNLDSNFFDSAAIGFNFPLFQFDYFIPEIYFQSVMSGNDFSKNGNAYGIYISSYPVKPVTLTYKYGKEDYDDYIVTENTFKIGLIIYRFEVFAGFQSLKSSDSKCSGYVFGMRVWL